MKIIYSLLLTLLLFAPSSINADETRLVSNTLFQYELPSNRWQVSQQAPQLAIDAMYVDLVHGKEKKDESYDPEKLKKMAEKFLNTNNLYIFNAETEAYLMVSIAPFKEESGIPGKKSIRASAKWAAEAIAEHAEVENLSKYNMSVEMIEIPGVKYAAKVDSNYPLFGEPHHFIGIIGYSHPYWVFIYYNDKLKQSQDLPEMKKLLDSFKFDKM
jgi:hypothetical protein